jgi:hypothetical protein
LFLGILGISMNFFEFSRVSGTITEFQEFRKTKEIQKLQEFL